VNGPAADAPIGVFDSGLGGLTVVRALMRQLPDERFLYVGDTARVPYGPKSPDTIRRYSREIAAYLLGEGVKAVVVACNTATAHALPVLRDELAMPVVGVVEPGARAAVAATRSGVIGVIGTAGTIGSGAYERAIRAVDPAARVVAQACPLFVPLVEEGWLDTEVTRLVAREYLGPLSASGIDTLVLGCTHYPLLAGAIAEVVGDGVQLIDSGDATAAATRTALEAAGLSLQPTAGSEPAGTERIERGSRGAVGAAGAAGTSAHRFVATDAPGLFLRAGRRFLGAAIERVETLTLA
jgi:glutamate racemase